MPIALSKTKPNESANDDMRKFKTNLAIEYPNKNPTLEASMDTTKPVNRNPYKVDESLDNLQRAKELREHEKQQEEVADAIKV